MPPQDFVRARETGQVCVEVDGRPYLPQTTASPKGPRRDVAAAVLAVLNFSADDDALDLLTVEPVTGGLSNTLFRVSGLLKACKKKATNNSASDQNDCNNTNNHQQGDLKMDAVLVRIFGAEGMIDRDLETSTFAALAREGLAPPYYGRFATGRLEGWMDGMRPLQVRELSLDPIIRGVAQQVALLHTHFHIPADLQEYYQTPSMWQQLEEWLNQALQNKYQNDHDASRAASLQLSTIKDEFEWMRREIIPPTAAVVYCHNDVLAANILYNEKTQSLRLIDFEYGGCNYKSFDLANHWNEYAGGPPNQTVPQYDWLPNQTQQTLFCRTYLETAAGTASVVTDQQVETLRREVQAFLLPNHLYWGLWGVNQAATEGCQDYDYMLYGMERFKQYHLCKKELLSKR